MNCKVMTAYRIKAFGITKDILGRRETVIELPGNTVEELKKELYGKYPELLGLRSLYVAVNNDYADDAKQLNANDEIALIPPVSGG
jgi:molybdopterin synthase sulfur carrier subunit